MTYEIIVEVHTFFALSVLMYGVMGRRLYLEYAERMLIFSSWWSWFIIFCIRFFIHYFMEEP